MDNRLDRIWDNACDELKAEAREFAASLGVKDAEAVARDYVIEQALTQSREEENKYAIDPSIFDFSDQNGLQQ
jgi:hypothetical protein